MNYFRVRVIYEGPGLNGYLKGKTLFFPEHSWVGLCFQILHCNSPSSESPPSPLHRWTSDRADFATSSVILSLFNSWPCLHHPPKTDLAKVPDGLFIVSVSLGLHRTFNTAGQFRFNLKSFLERIFFFLKQSQTYRKVLSVIQRFF